MTQTVMQAVTALGRVLGVLILLVALVAQCPSSRAGDATDSGSDATSDAASDSSNTASDDSATGIKTRLLQGSLVHSDTLPPVDSVHIGMARADVKIHMEQQYIWRKVPEWLAGGWRTISLIDSDPVPMDKENGPLVYTHHKIDESSYEGTIRDSSGQIWRYDRVPEMWSREVDGFPEDIVTTAFKVNEPLKQERTCILIKYKDDKVYKIIQREQISYTYPIDKKHCFCDFSEVRYDENGQPLNKYLSHGVYVKTSKFRPTTNPRVIEAFEQFQKQQQGQTDQQSQTNAKSQTNP